MTQRTKKISGGFTLVETIAACVVLCLAVMLLARGTTRYLVETRLNRQYEIAAALADKQITLIDYFGIENFVESGQTEGQFEDFEGYHWTAAATSQGVGNLYLVNVTVGWVHRNRPYSVSVDTMLNGTGMFAETETETEVSE